MTGLPPIQTESLSRQQARRRREPTSRLTADTVRDGRVFWRLGADGLLFAITVVLAALVMLAGLFAAVKAGVDWAGGPRPMTVALETREVLRLPADSGVTSVAGAKRSFEWSSPTESAWSIQQATRALVGLCLAAGAGAYVLFARSVHCGRPFGRAFRWAAVLGSAALAVGIWGQSFGDGLVGIEFLGTASSSLTSAFEEAGSVMTVDPDHSVATAAEFPLWPLAVMLVAGLADVAFTYGRRLEEDTEGLV